MPSRATPDPSLIASCLQALRHLALYRNGAGEARPGRRPSGRAFTRLPCPRVTASRQRAARAARLPASRAAGPCVPARSRRACQSRGSAGRPRPRRALAAAGAAYPGRIERRPRRRAREPVARGGVVVVLGLFELGHQPAERAAPRRRPSPRRPPARWRRASPQSRASSAAAASASWLSRWSGLSAASRSIRFRRCSGGSSAKSARIGRGELRMWRRAPRRLERPARAPCLAARRAAARHSARRSARRPAPAPCALAASRIASPARPCGSAVAALLVQHHGWRWRLSAAGSALRRVASASVASAAAHCPARACSSKRLVSTQGVRGRKRLGALGEAQRRRLVAAASTPA